MKILTINKIHIYPIFGAIVFSMLWYVLPIAIQWYNDTAGIIDGSIWLLLLFTLISFISLVFLCGWMLKLFFRQLGLPKIHTMVSHFNKLELWQQFALYWASFALLLLAGVLSLIAVF